MAYEMEPTSASGDRNGRSSSSNNNNKDTAGVSVRSRSMSHGMASGTANGTSARDGNYLSVPGQEGGLARSSSVSNRFTDGIKRRFGSLRRKS